MPDVIVLKNDPSSIQGIPDITVFGENCWATLECKRSKDASIRPNQEYYVDKMNRMCFSSFIYPENKDEVVENMVKLFNEKRLKNKR